MYRYIENTSLRTIISNTTAVLYLNVVLRSLNMMQKADYFIFKEILGETKAKAIVQKYIICEQLMSFYKFLSWIPSIKSNAALQHPKHIDNQSIFN